MDTSTIIFIVLYAAIGLGIIGGLIACAVVAMRSKITNTQIASWSITLAITIFPFLFFLFILKLASSKPTEESFIAAFTYTLFEILLLLVFTRWIRRKVVWIPFLCVTLCFGAGCGMFYRHWAYEDGLATVTESANLLWQYDPANDENNLTLLDEPSILSLKDDLPRLDGATALYPVYAAFANAVYPREAIITNEVQTEDSITVNRKSEVLVCTKTTQAYENLVNGEADIIFVAGPSEAQLQYAAEKGEEMVFTPIGRECFVFFVNAQNPVDALTVEQLRSVYSGEITQWKELGADLGKIRPFQRDEGSGSQSTMVRFMGDIPLMEPEMDDRVDGMGDIIERTADYRNYPNAIGYSFRFYSTEMVQNGEIKLLELNGVAPTKENILNDTYPVSDVFYAVTLASNDNPNVDLLIEWILSDQGQELIDKTGYVALK